MRSMVIPQPPSVESRRTEVPASEGPQQIRRFLRQYQPMDVPRDEAFGWESMHKVNHDLTHKRPWF